MLSALKYRCLWNRTSWSHMYEVLALKSGIEIILQTGQVYYFICYLICKWIKLRIHFSTLSAFKKGAVDRRVIVYWNVWFHHYLAKYRLALIISILECKICIFESISWRYLQVFERIIVLFLLKPHGGNSTIDFYGWRLLSRVSCWWNL